MKLALFVHAILSIVYAIAGIIALASGIDKLVQHYAQIELFFSPDTFAIACWTFIVSLIFAVLNMVLMVK